jgi:iron complex transport system substrate-binding protein
MFFIICWLLMPGLVLADQVIDQAGRTVELPTEITRVVSLAPSITEVVYSLGKEALLKGATQYSDDPPEARLLPRVGSYVRLDVEKIVALRPDLCLAIRDGNPLHTVDKIESLGIPVYVIDPRSLESIMEMIVGLGNILGAADKAAEITADMQRRITAVNDKLVGTDLRPKVFFQIDAEPIVSAGSNTFIDELITMAGGINLAAGVGIAAYPKFSWEDVLAFQPDVAIVASMAGGFTVDSLRAGWQRWPQIPAVKNNRVHVVAAGLVDRPTPRLVDGLETFARIIHPELFGEALAD